MGSGDREYIHNSNHLHSNINQVASPIGNNTNNTAPETR